jgi:hypothetical protein
MIETVVASAAKQSRLSDARKAGLLRRFAPRNDDFQGLHLKQSLKHITSMSRAR